MDIWQNVGLIFFFILDALKYLLSLNIIFPIFLLLFSLFKEFISDYFHWKQVRRKHSMLQTRDFLQAAVEP